MSNDYDLIVLGGGPGGYVAAIRGARRGMKVAVVEKGKLGGVCLNWGCIPTKALLKSAEQMAFLKESKKWGFEYEHLEVDFHSIIKRSRQVADISAKGVGYLMKENKIPVFSGSGRLLDSSTLAVTDHHRNEVERLTGKHIIIATGGRALMLPGLKPDGERIVTSTEAMVMKKAPESLIVIGAGAIGMEFAYFFHTFGSNITVIEMLPSILPNEDEEVSRELRRVYKKAGMELCTESRVESVVIDKEEVVATVSAKDGQKKVKGRTCLVAIGIQGNIEDIGLEEVGVKTENGAIKVDEYMRTNVDGVYAIGDVVGPPWLAHIASHEAIVCVDKIAGQDKPGMNYDSFPSCTYCHPQVASIGLTEKQAREKGHEIKVGKFPFIANGKARALGEKNGFVKTIFEETTGRLLGAHIIGPEATEMIAEFALAMTAKLTYKDIAHTIHAHPTLAEAMLEASLGAFGEGIHI